MPTNMWPSSMKARPPNILRSATPRRSLSSSRTRSARPSSNAIAASAGRARVAPGLFRRPRLDPRRSRELAGDARHALVFALGGEALVEPLDAEGVQLPAPGRKPLLPAPDAAFGRFGVL